MFLLQSRILTLNLLVHPQLQLLDINLTVFLIQLIRYFYYLENVHIS